jgi:16S rRNA (adenine1518-N6/adenine1519-N6)-dimethyltransferase
VKARWYCDVEPAGSIGTSVFWPVPHVESGLVRMTRHEAPASSAGREATFAVVDGAFAQRRKTLRSALASLAGSPALAERALVAAGVDPSLRGEQLDVAAFARIADALAAERDRASSGESA